MGFFSTFSEHRKTLLATLLVAMVPLAHASKLDEQINDVISSIPSYEQDTSTNNSSFSQSTPNSSVTLDFSINAGESWDAKDREINTVTNCINGTAITGFEYFNVTLETFAGSYYSEAVLYFSDSNLGDNGIRLVVGSGNASAGTASFSSAELIDISDIGREDVVSLSDNKFFLQFYEIIDDARNAVDARYISGQVKVYGADLVIADNCEYSNGNSILEADLSVTYEAGQVDAVIGDSISFEMKISNNSANEAKNIVIANQLSANQQFINLSCNDGTVIDDTDGASLSMVNLQNIPADSSITCLLNSEVTANGDIKNQVTVISDNDSNVSNNSASTTIFGFGVVVPANNWLALLLLILGVIIFSRRSHLGSSQR